MTGSSFWDLSYRDGSYLEHWEPTVDPPELLAFLEERPWPAAMRVVDLGCGAGYEARLLAARGFSAIGVDASLSALLEARRHGEEASGGRAPLWLRCSVGALPLPAASVDLAMDRGCLHCIAASLRWSYAVEVSRVLRPGGRLLLRAAREDDEEAGLVGVDDEDLAELFPSPYFARSSLRPCRLVARSGTLEGVVAVVEKGRSADGAD